MRVEVWFFVFYALVPKGDYIWLVEDYSGHSLEDDDLLKFIGWFRISFSKASNLIGKVSVYGIENWGSSPWRFYKPDGMVAERLCVPL